MFIFQSNPACSFLVTYICEALRAIHLAMCRLLLHCYAHLNLDIIHSCESATEQVKEMNAGQAGPRARKESRKYEVNLIFSRKPAEYSGAHLIFVSVSHQQLF